MSNEQVAPETKGVTVKLLTTVDLGPEIEGMAGRQFRMRLVNHSSELIHQIYQRERVDDVAQWRDAVKFPA